MLHQSTITNINSHRSPQNLETAELLPYNCSIATYRETHTSRDSLRPAIPTSLRFTSIVGSSRGNSTAGKRVTKGLKDSNNKHHARLRKPVPGAPLASSRFFECLRSCHKCNTDMQTPKSPGPSRWASSTSVS